MLRCPDGGEEKWGQGEIITLTVSAFVHKRSGKSERRQMGAP